MKVLVTGAAGFIGFHFVNRLLHEGHHVVGIDNLNDYSDVSLKYSRLENLGINANQIKYGEPVNSLKYLQFHFIKLNIEDQILFEIFEKEHFDYVINLAAQAGVRYSITNPKTYIQSNITGFLNILEGCRQYSIQHLVYASSSSVYGLNQKFPFSTHHNVDHPVSLYAASKKSNELMAHAYSYLFNIPTTGLRFFTVYGPWGRPDMALFKFTKAILGGVEIEVYNNGQMERDFTYIDDIIEGMYRIMMRPPNSNKYWSGISPDPSSSVAPYRLYNIGNSQPVSLIDFINAIENETGINAKIIYKPIQPGDIIRTWADTTDLQRDFGYKPFTPVSEGIRNFVQWFKQYYKI